MEGNPINNDARRTERKAKLGQKPVCILCSDSRLDALVTVARQLVEKHHVVGQAHDDLLTVLLCGTCHKIVTEMYRRGGLSMKPAPDLLRRLVARLRGIGLFLPEVGSACRRYADELESLIEALDRHDDTWRDIPEAK